MPRLTCDPCRLCVHLWEDWRDYNDTGVVDYGCDAEDCDWEGEEQGPCPWFKGILPSEYLMWQLIEEEDARQWMEECDDTR